MGWEDARTSSATWGRGKAVRQVTVRFGRGCKISINWVGRATPYPPHDIPGTGPMAYRLASDGPEGLVYQIHHLGAATLGGGFEAAYDCS